jgi:4-hydroxybenzoyl-CoA thioesterase
VRLEADFRAVSQMGDWVKLSLSIERLGGRSLTLNLRCTGANNELRMSVRQVIVTTSLNGHHAIEIPTDLRIALMRFDGKTLESL